MKKNYKIIIIVGIVALILGIIKLMSPSFEKTYKKVKENLKSYALEGNMEINEEGELRQYQVNVSYALLDNQDYFKVVLYDKNLNQSQTILRNEKGVFVLTPTLSQAFKFKSDWPFNSPKPYIYQSLLDFYQGKVEKVKDGYVVKGDITYPNYKTITHQEIRFDKKLNPIYVSLFNDTEEEVIHFEVTAFDGDKEFKKEDFNEEVIFTSSSSSYLDHQLPLYPSVLLGSTLQEESVSSIQGSTNHILQFSGDKSFTLIESIEKNPETYTIVDVDSEMIDLVDRVAIVTSHGIQMAQSGVLCTIYSNDLTQEEMIEVISSMQIVDSK